MAFPFCSGGWCSRRQLGRDDFAVRGGWVGAQLRRPNRSSGGDGAIERIGRDQPLKGCGWRAARPAQSRLAHAFVQPQPLALDGGDRLTIGWRARSRSVARTAVISGKLCNGALTTAAATARTATLSFGRI